MTSRPDESQELLENTHEFPCSYVFKAIGPNDEEFQSAVVQAVREALSLAFDPPCDVQRSSAGRHASLTLTVTVESAAQILATYDQLRGVARLRMLL